MKKFLAVLLGVLFASSFVFAQDVNLEQLKKQVADLQAQVDMMSKFVNTNTRHAATDKLSISAEFMTRFDSFQYKDVRALPDFASDMMALWLSESLASTSGAGFTSWDKDEDGFNDAFMAKYYADFGQVMMNPQIVGMFMSMGAPDPNDNLSGYQGFAMNKFAELLSSRTVLLNI